MRSLSALATTVAGGAEQARAVRQRWAGLDAVSGDARALELAVLLSCAYPAMEAPLAARPAVLLDVARSGTATRDARAYKKALATLVPAFGAARDAAADAVLAHVRAVLRRFALRERTRIAF